jgi:DUF4097 and DUF4098 domain-containing protein YvlB
MKHLFVLALAALILVGMLTASPDASAQGTHTKSFNVSKGGSLVVSTSVGDIRIRTWDKGEVAVAIEGLDAEELGRVSMTQSGNSVRVSYRSRGHSGGDALFEFSIPAEFDVELSTSGGDLQIGGPLKGKVEGTTAGGEIKIGNISGGPVEMSTSGGDVTVGDLQCEARLKTSGGDIRAGKVTSDLEVSTSGGDITVDEVKKKLDARTSGGNITVGDVGGEARLSTAGGDVRVGKVAGRANLSTAGGDIELMGASGVVSAKTAGGDVRLKGVSGSIDAKTAGGEIDAELTPAGKGDSKMMTAGGDIRLAIAENAKVTIEATIQVDNSGRLERYQVRSDFKADSYETDKAGAEIRAVYKLNGGGDRIILQTVNSDIHIRKLAGK